MYHSEITTLHSASLIDIHFEDLLENLAEIFLSRDVVLGVPCVEAVPPGVRSGNP